MENNQGFRDTEVEAVQEIDITRSDIPFVRCIPILPAFEGNRREPTAREREALDAALDTILAPINSSGRVDDPAELQKRMIVALQLDELRKLLGVTDDAQLLGIITRAVYGR